MVKGNIIIIMAVVLLSGLSVIALSDETLDSVDVNPEQLQLPENVKTDLLLEMATITRLMGDLLEYMVQGDVKHSATIAMEIRDTNFRQKSDSKELKQIMKSLPKGYIELNRRFHSLANELVKAVDANDFKTATSLYSEMTQGCFNCHAAYAKTRFPNLESE